MIVGKLRERLSNSLGDTTQFGIDKPTKKKKRMGLNHLLYVIFLTFAFAAAILWASVTLFEYLRSQWRPSDEIVIGTFTPIGQGLPSDPKTVGTALASKLERLKRLASRQSSGFGLIQTPILTSVPAQFSERQSDARKRLESLNLKVKDLDVKSIIDAIQSAFAPARPILEGQVSEIGDRIEIRAELTWKENTIGGWVASRTKSAQIQDTLNDVYDDLLFQMIYDIPRNPKLHWWAEAKGDDAIPNWQALEALTLGLQALQTYEQGLEYADLQRAIKQLDRIPVYAPGYAQGHYFLAIALGEDRQEERAAALMAQVEGMEATQMLKWSAAFQRAAALLRRYRRVPADEAATKVLNPLIAELQSVATNKGSSAEEKEFASRLLPMAYAQLAYTYGTLLTLSSAWSEKELDDLKDQSEDASEKGWAAFNQVNTKWSSDRERKGVERWLYNTQGYSRFRIAYIVERGQALRGGKLPPEEIDKVFRTSCESALRDLRKANEIMPNNYEVLQNEAMILDDPVYDPSGAELGEAEALYERTKLFVPRDYYQYERLAIIYWRQLKSNPATSIQNVLINKGQKAVSSARESRFPEKSRTAEVLGAYFSTWQAKLEADTAKKHETITSAIQQAEEAVVLKAPHEEGHETAELMRNVAGELSGVDQKAKELKEKLLETAKKLDAL